MGVARSPETAANPFRIISQTLPAQMRAGPLPKSYGTRQAASGKALSAQMRARPYRRVMGPGGQRPAKTPGCCKLGSAAHKCAAMRL
jgi:hypothetical protein